MPRSNNPEPDAHEWSDLSSFVHGLYMEMDKLAKKAPSSQISDLAQDRVNRAIREANAMAAGHDKYVADLVEFVAAGDNTEVRDALLVLREIEEGLERLGTGSTSDQKRAALGRTGSLAARSFRPRAGPTRGRLRYSPARRRPAALH